MALRQVTGCERHHTDPWYSANDLQRHIETSFASQVKLAGCPSVCMVMLLICWLYQSTVAINDNIFWLFVFAVFTLGFSFLATNIGARATCQAHVIDSKQ